MEWVRVVLLVEVETMLDCLVLAVAIRELTCESTETQIDEIMQKTGLGQYLLDYLAVCIKESDPVKEFLACEVLWSLINLVSQKGYELPLLQLSEKNMWETEA